MTMVGGGTGPANGNKATTYTQGPWNLHRMTVELSFLGKGNDSLEPALIEQIEAGA